MEDTIGDHSLYEGSINEYIKFINVGKTPVNENIIHLEGEDESVFFKFNVIQYRI